MDVSHFPTAKVLNLIIDINIYIYIYIYKYFIVINFIMLQTNIGESIM